ncbi:unnamed protein product [Strongylus vulgaris]|uniref:G-protein coupled receptors family 1 profile domain-containing protein n=1 Tax=Strongylus vulgaris TaxID=40348 RepID=A0A3P7J5P3_STRVU|nr:unnamed protein product [Strongylus vulgaris]
MHINLQILIAASTLLIVSASFERYICSIRSSAGIAPKTRRIVIGIVIISAVIMKLRSCALFFAKIQNTDFFKQLPTLLPLGGQASEAKRKKRDATRTMAALVTVYLVSNTLNLLLTIMEFIDAEFLRELAKGLVYRYLADLSSLLTISSTATRLPIYYHCNYEIRKQLKQFFGQFQLRKYISVPQSL